MPISSDDFPEPQLSGEPERGRFFRGESIDIRVRLRNPSPEVMRLPGIEPGNNAIQFVMRHPDGRTGAPLTDSTAMALKGVEPDLDEESEEVVLEPNSELVEVYDLQQYTGVLALGTYDVRIQYPCLELEADAVSFEIVEPLRPRSARANWEYDRGAASDGYCLWTTNDEFRPGTYLRVYPSSALSYIVSNRRITEDVLPEGAGLSRVSRAEGDVRHVYWGDGDSLRIDSLRGGKLERSPIVVPRDGVRRVLTDPEDQGWLVRVVDADAQGRGEVRAECLVFGAPQGVPLTLGHTRDPRSVLDAVIDFQGRLWVAWVDAGRLMLIGCGLGDSNSERWTDSWELPEQAARWISVVPRAVVRNEDVFLEPEVDVFLARDTGEATLVRAVRGDSLQRLGEGATPSGIVHDALVDRNSRIHLVFDWDGQLSYCCLGSRSGARPLDSRCYAQAWSELLTSGVEDGQRVYIRGVTEEGLLVHEPV